MAIQMNDQLPDVTYWLTLEIAKNERVIDLDQAYQGSAELDVLYQLLTSKAQLHWWQYHGIELSTVTVNNAFFRAVAILHERSVEFSRSRHSSETDWVKALLHL